MSYTVFSSELTHTNPRRPLLIITGIVVGFPYRIIWTLRNIQTGQQSPLVVFLLSVFVVVVVAAFVFVERGQRRIPVQYAKRQSTHLPLRVNTGGVFPVIFASSIIVLPQTFASMFPNSAWMTNIAQQLAWGMPFYTLIYAAAIVFFCCFYTAIIFNPDDVADNMTKYGGYIPGIQPGKPTAEHIDTILSRLTFGRALYLAAVFAIMPFLPRFLLAGIRVAPLSVIGPWLDSVLPAFVTEGLAIPYYLGATLLLSSLVSLLIVVGLAMDTVQRIQSQRTQAKNNVQP